MDRAPMRPDRCMCHVVRFQGGTEVRVEVTGEVATGLEAVRNMLVRASSGCGERMEDTTLTGIERKERGQRRKERGERRKERGQRRKESRERKERKEKGP